MISHWLRFRKIEHTVSFHMTLLVTVVIGATLLVVHSRVKSGLLRGLETQGHAIAQSIGAVSTPNLLAYNAIALQSASERAAKDPSVEYVIIHDKEGRVVGASGTEEGDGIARRMEPSWFNGSRETLRTSEAGLSIPALESIVAVRVDKSSQPWGHVRVGMSFDSVHVELSRMRWGLLLLGLILTMCAMAMGRWVAGKITEPLRMLAHGTEALAWGEASRRIPESGSDELAELAQSFNRMFDRIEEKAFESLAYQDALSKLNATLEEQVLERTRALEESERQYRTLVDDSPDCIMIFQDEAVVFVNHSFCQTFGVAAGDVHSDQFQLDDLFEGESSSRVRQRLRELEMGREFQTEEVVGRDAAGSLRTLEFRGSRIEYKGRSAAEALLVDRTEAKRLREQLEDSDRLRSLGELAGGVAHDFNNLLGAILGRVQMLRRGTPDEGVDLDLALIEKAAKDGRETVRRIQEFSKLQATRSFRGVNLCDLLQDAVELTRTRWKTEAERRNIGIQVNMHLESVDLILGNPGELREVFTNLIMNACDALPQGGEVALRTRSEQGSVIVEVEDTGVGMTDEIRRHLFDPFFTTKGLAGTGLGLSVAYGIVKRHQGTIDVESRMGRGTRFILTFPVESLDVMTEQEPSPETVLAPVRPSRILVIDDEAAIAQLLEDALESDGHTVETAGSGKEGIQMAGLAHFDLVLTDLGMPDMSGWEVAERILRAHPGMPVILVTGWGATISDQEIVSSGVAAVVQKPFEIQDLLNTASSVLSRLPTASL